MGINWSNTWLAMGRVSKHKKIKACDPFYKGPRRDTLRTDNLPPGGLEDCQPVPKSLLRLIQAGQRTSRAHNKSVSKAKLSQQGQVIGTTCKPPGDGSHSTPEESSSLRNEKEKPVFKRRKGESLKDFLERIDVEGRARMVQSCKANRKITERRKKYYEKRKQRLESRKGRGKREEGAVEFDDLKDNVRFGEVASAPPRLIAKPRGSLKTSTKAKSQDAKPNPETEKSMTKDLNPSTVSVHVVGLKRKQDIEDERERMIQEYRVTKKAKLSRTKLKNRQLIL